VLHTTQAAMTVAVNAMNQGETVTMMLEATKSEWQGLKNAQLFELN
jgi:hypothetical protein